jgi:hypothetical protein
VARYSRQGPQMCQQTARPGAPKKSNGAGRTRLGSPAMTRTMLALAALLVAGQASAQDALTGRSASSTPSTTAAATTQSTQRCSKGSIERSTMWARKRRPG